MIEIDFHRLERFLRLNELRFTNLVIGEYLIDNSNGHAVVTWCLQLVLKDNKFFIESQYPEVLRELLRNPTVRNARILEEMNKPDSQLSANTANTSVPDPRDGFQEGAAPESESNTNELFHRLNALDEEDKVSHASHELFMIF